MGTADKDWRLPENRREAFQRSYTFSLQHKSFPGMVYSFLPAIAEAFDADDDQRAWLAWLNGNTQNPVTTLLLFEEAPYPHMWGKAVDFWNEHFRQLAWDTDRRHQKSKFGEATEDWWLGGNGSVKPWWDLAPLAPLGTAAPWDKTWDYVRSLPHMGRLSAWSYLEFARILLPRDGIPDAGSWLLEDKSGSRSHRNGLAVVAGYDAVYWDAETADFLGLVGELELLADSLLAEAMERNEMQPWSWMVSRLSMESALCTYKSWHKPNRRYPNVYADMAYERIKQAEARFGRTFDLLWETRKRDLPEYLRLEDNPYDPGLCPAKQNYYRETGQIPLLHNMFDDMEPSGFDTMVEKGMFGQRKDKKWD